MQQPGSNGLNRIIFRHVAHDSVFSLVKKACLAEQMVERRAERCFRSPMISRLRIRGLQLSSAYRSGHEAPVLCCTALYCTGSQQLHISHIAHCTSSTPSLRRAAVGGFRGECGVLNSLSFPVRILLLPLIVSHMNHCRCPIV